MNTRKRLLTYFGWTRPEDDEPVATVSSPTPRSELPEPPTTIEPVPTPTPTVEGEQLSRSAFTVEPVNPNAATGMSTTMKIAWVMAILSAASTLYSQGLADGAALDGWVLVDMTFTAVIWFGIVTLVGWIISKVRKKPSGTTAPSPAYNASRQVPTSVDGGATIEASLRRLKALHDDGILTEDEYETKRKALTDQL